MGTNLQNDWVLINFSLLKFYIKYCEYGKFADEILSVNVVKPKAVSISEVHHLGATLYFNLKKNTILLNKQKYDKKDT